MAPALVRLAVPGELRYGAIDNRSPNPQHCHGLRLIRLAGFAGIIGVADGD